MEKQKFRLIKNLGLTELVYISISLILILSIGIFHATGIGKPPNVTIEVYVENHDIKIRVLEGEVPKADWEYIYFDIRTNPPIVWFKAPTDLKPGVEITLAKNLPPGTYKIQIIHKPTMRIIFEEKVTIS